MLNREYYRCDTCDLTFVPSQHFLSKTEETIHYNFHQNSPEDSNYRRFLNKLCDPMLELLHAESSGFDYGCGPGPTLSLMLEERGHAMNIYDYIFAADTAVLDKTYDFITCTETVEHFREPRDDLFRMWQLLKPDGHLGIMTSFVTDNIDFEDWHYKNDPTHICFYSSDTVQWLAGVWDAAIVYQADDVVIVKKTTETAIV